MSIYSSIIDNITSNECESIENMAKSAAKIAFYNFKWQFVTLVLFNATITCGVTSFLRSYQKNAVVANDNPKLPLRTRQFVLFVRNFDNFVHLLKWMEEQNFDNTARHLVICQSHKRRECDEVDAIEYLWHHRIMNVIFINDVFKNGTAGFYYNYGEECKNTPPIKVENWDSCVYTNQSQYCAGKFPVPFENMYGCPMTVSTIHQPPYMYINDGVPSGADGDLLKIIIEALNATLVLVLPRRGDGWGNLDENGSWVGSLSDLYYDEANMSMTSASITQARYSAFELSNFYLTINVVWVTHPSSPESSYHKLLRPFKPIVRVILFVSFSFVFVIAGIFKMKFFNLILHEVNSSQIPNSVIFRAWEICMGQPITVYPMKMAVKYLVLLWIWYCFLMRTLYQVHLINSLKTDVYPSEFSSLEDAIAEGYAFGGGLAIREYYIDSPSVYESWVGIDSSEYPSMLLNLTKGIPYVLAVNIAAVQRFLKVPGRKLHVLPQKVVCSPVGIFLKKFSPFTLVLDRILKRLYEFGFPQTIFKKNTQTDFVEKMANENKPIKLVYFTGCYIIVTTDNFLLPEPEALRKIGRIAAKIAYYNFDWRYVTLVMFYTVQHVTAIHSFLSNYKQSVVVKYGKFIPHYRNAVPQYIIFGKDAASLVDTISWLDASKYDNSGKYIIICTSPDNEDCEESLIFITLAKVFILNAIYLRADTIDEFTAFSYDIVTPEKCLNTEANTLNITDDCAFDDCFKELYQDKLKNFYKCPLKVSTFEQPPFMYLNNVTLEPSGGDGDIIKLVAKALNATLEIKTPTEGNEAGLYQDNNWTGSLGDVFNDRVHVSVCSLPVTANKYGNFTISFIYDTMDIVWIAQLPVVKPAWQKLLSPFDTSLRIILFFVFIGVIILNAFIRSNTWRTMRRVVKISPIRYNLLFYSWALFLAIPILKMPKKRPLLLIVYTWIWFCFIVKNAYQSVLMKSLKNENFGEFFSNFESVLKSKQPYGGLATLREYYKNEPLIYDKWISLDYDDAMDTLDRISNESSDFVLAINKEIVIEHLIKHNGNRHLQIIPEKIVNSPTVMYFKKYSVFTQAVSYVLSNAVEAGLTQLTYLNYIEHKKLLSKRVGTRRGKSLTIDNFKACIFLMVFGWGLAIIFFATEAFCGRIVD